MLSCQPAKITNSKEATACNPAREVFTWEKRFKSTLLESSWLQKVKVQSNTLLNIIAGWCPFFIIRPIRSDYYVTICSRIKTSRLFRDSISNIFLFFCKWIFWLSLCRKTAVVLKRLALRNDISYKHHIVEPTIVEWCNCEIWLQNRARESKIVVFFCFFVLRHPEMQWNIW